MRPVLLLALLLGGRPALAQVLARAAPPDRPGPAGAAPPAAPDTVAALHRLFAAKRSRRNVVLLRTVAAGGAVAALALAGSNNGYDQVGAVLLGVATLGIGTAELAGYNHRYSRRHERQAIRDFQAHRLAPALQGRLASRYFLPAPP